VNEIPAERPHYDHETHTHYVELPRLTFDAMRSPLAMLDISLLADSVAADEWIWIECDDDAVLLEVTGIAAVTRPAPEQPQ
jgi:hypothetical protein